ncbi:WD40-repeat-containing domain protein [Hyaloraphidium curvatum]|nr:WD40-repeat-containing domain protein [Hyaloraphidium curvatum]
MLCSISGEPPQEPVVSRKSGALFERRLVLKYIAEHGTDPASGEPLAEDDLVPLRAAPAVRPRPPAATSIPALLASMQSEWDANMLETFQLKQQYHQVRQELTNALYQHDAACRVIARLTRERDEARAALANVQASLASGAAAAPDGDRMDVDQRPPARAAEGITDEIIEKMTETSTSLSKVRRKRKPAPTLASPEAISSYSTKRETHSLHSSTQPGILSLDLLAARNLALTGGKDGGLTVVDVEAGKVVADLPKAHSNKKVGCVTWQSQTSGSAAFLSGGADKVVRCWELGADGAVGKYSVKTAHSAEVTGLSVHASGEYYVSAGLDGVWSFGIFEDGRVVQKVTHPEVTGYTTCAFHPDGLILATGTTDGKLRLWDIKAQSNVATFENHKGKVTALAFSENGYTVATGSDGEGVVRIWDLRKLDQTGTIEVEGADKVHGVAFDYSGQYLGVAAGANVSVYPHKTFNPAILSLDSAHDGKEVTHVAFGTDAKYLISVGMDRTLRLYAGEE